MKKASTRKEDARKLALDTFLSAVRTEAENVIGIGAILRELGRQQPIETMMGPALDYLSWMATDLCRQQGRSAMNTNPKLVMLIQRWRQLDAQGAMLEKEKKGKKSDDVTARATRLIRAIGDMEATSVDDIMLKLDFACEAYGAATQGRAKFIEAGDLPLDFLFQSILDARRIVNRPQPITPAQSALLNAANVVSSLEDAIGSLVVIGNVMVEEEKTAECRALGFTTCKLMEDVEAIGEAVNVARGLPADGD